MSENLKIFVHCSDSTWGHASLINLWHRERWGHLMNDKNKPEIGYHYVILNGYPTADHVKNDRVIRILDGQIEIGRPTDADDELEAHEYGAQVYGFNKRSFGICLIGTDTFSKNQIHSLIKVIKLLQFQFHVTTGNVLGHSEVDSGKSCPNLDMELIRKLVRNKSEVIRLMGSLRNLFENH